MYSGINSKVAVRDRIIAKAFLILSVLLLILSCPIKRFFQINAVSPVNFSKTEKQTANVHSHVRYVSGCAAGEKNIVSHDQSTIHAKSSPQQTNNANAPSGFDLNYFLSRIRNQASSSPSVLISSLPLFLQKRSLLI